MNESGITGTLIPGKRRKLAHQKRVVPTCAQGCQGRAEHSSEGPAATAPTSSNEPS